MRPAAPKTDFANVPRAFGTPRGGLGAPLWAPRLAFDPTLEIVRVRVRLASFCVPGGTPPGTPISPKHTYFLWFFNTFKANRGPKRSPLGPPFIEPWPPRAPPRPPKIMCARPRGRRGLPGRPNTLQNGARAPPIQVRPRKSKYCFPRGPGTLFFVKVPVAPVGSIVLRSKKVPPQGPRGG